MTRWAALRVGRALALLLSGAALLCLVAMNAFLSTPLFAAVIDGQPATIDVHFRRAWSYLPGHIHATDLSIRGRDGNVEWILRLDEVEFDVSFAALAHRRFEASHVYGRGASFRLRQRLDAPPRSPAEVADLPPIAGLPPFALRPSPHPEPEKWSDAAYRLWTARLDDVVANDVREVWIDHFRFEGRARIAGRFYLKPLRRAEIGPIRIDARDGRVRTGATLIVDRLADAAIDVRVVPFDPRTLQGSEVLRQLSLKVDAHPVLADLGLLLPRLPEGVNAVSGAADVHRMVVDMRGGALQEGSKVQATLPKAIVTRGEYRFAAAIDLAGAVDHVEGSSRLDFRARLGDLDVDRYSGALAAPGAVLHVPEMKVTGDAGALTIANLLADLHLVADVTSCELPDLRVLTPYIPQGVPLALKGGSGKLTAHLEAWRNDKRAVGNARLDVDDFRLRLGNMRVQGATSIEASFGSFPWETSRMQDATLSLQIAGGSLASEERPEVALVRVADLRVDTSAATVALQDPLRELSAVISLRGGEIVDPDLLRAYLPKGSEMHLLPGRARFSLASALKLVSHLASGTLDVQSTQLGLSFRDFRIHGDVRGKARVHGWLWERGVLALDRADVDVTNVCVDVAGSEAGARSEPPARSDRSPSHSTGPALSFGRISMSAHSPRFSFGDPLGRLQLSAALVDATVHDSAIVNAFLPAGAPFAIRAKDGAFSSDVQATIVGHVLDGTVAVRARGMGIGGKSFFLGGDVGVRARVSDWDFAGNTLAVQSARLLFSNVEGGFHAGAADGPDATSGTGAGGVDFRAALVEVWAKTPKLDLVRPSRRGLDTRVAVTGAELPDATVLQQLMPASSIVAVESGSAHLSANLIVSSTKRTAEGELDMELAHTGIRFHETHLAGNFKLSARLLGYDPDDDSFDVSGSRFTMRDVQVTNASTSVTDWYGDAVFDGATFHLGLRPELDGQLRIEALDASPILAILLGNGIPRFFVGLTSMPHLSGAARLTMGARHFAFRDIDARGGDLSIEGVYVLGQSHRAGAFVVAKGPFSAGFRLDDVGAHLRFFGLRSWLREETRSSLRLLDDAASPSDAKPSVASP